MNETKLPINHGPLLGAGAFSGPGAKALLVGLLVIAFLLPLALVQRIVDDRRSTRAAAEDSIIGPAGGRPSLFGPFLAVPYDVLRDKELVRGEIIVLPDALSLDCTLRTETRKRGIFSAPLLSADLAIQGGFGPLAAVPAPPGARVRWDQARLVLEFGDLRALQATPDVSWAGEKLVLQPEPGQGRAYAKATSAHVGAALGQGYAFTANLKLRGGRSLSFLEPSGEVRATVRGDWSGPSFRGYVLPTERTVGKEGFSATWRLPESAQDMPRSFDASAIAGGEAEKAAFGVDLLDGVDAYDMSWRAVRYGMLFIIVPFAVIFLFELLSKSRVHPVQYILVGLANCLFYLLLLSLSEVLPFAWAYAAAALACSLLAGSYAAAALRSRRGLLVLPALALLYAYLFVALSSEDYALLIGSLGLLAMLAAAMAATRKIDWYERRSKRPGSEAGSPRGPAEGYDAPEGGAAPEGGPA